MSRCLRVCALAVALAATSTSAQEQSDGAWEVELSVPLAALTGHTTYRIQAADQTGSVESELEFPLGGFVAGGRGQLASQRDQNRRRVVFEATALLSFTGSEGTLKDSDWFSDSIDISTVGAAHPGKDIYSESKARLSALVLEGRAAWELEASPGLSIAPLVGVLYQRFGYEVRDVVQVGYGPYATPTSPVRPAGPSSTTRSATGRSTPARAERSCSEAARSRRRPGTARSRTPRTATTTCSAPSCRRATPTGARGRRASPGALRSDRPTPCRRSSPSSGSPRPEPSSSASTRARTPGAPGSIDTTITSSRTTVVLVYSHRI